MKQNKEKPPTQPLVFFKTDPSGYIVNESDLKNIKKPWTDVLEDIKQVCEKYFAGILHSIYIFGEFTKGKPIKGTSDFGVLIITNKETDIKWLDDYVSYLIEKYPFTNKIQIKAQLYNIVLKSESYLFSIKTQYVCIYGSNIALKIDKYKPDSKILFKSKRYLSHYSMWLTALHKNRNNPELVKYFCFIIASMTLMSCFEICIEKEKKYTTDFYTCYRIFSKYYPDKEPLIRKFYYLTLDPTTDFDEIIKISDNLCKWLIATIMLRIVEEETKKNLE